jgi:putative redox-active protein with C_GCAxxG_C_C motif
VFLAATAPICAVTKAPTLAAVRRAPPAPVLDRRDILVFGRVPLRCMGVVRLAPERSVEIDGRPCGEALSTEERRACARLHAHFVARDFHCAHAVLREARGAEAVEPALLDAASAFVGGTAYAGLTCSALTAGVMLLGLARGHGEHSPRRILRAMAAMAAGGRAFAEDLDAVNGAMNEGHELATWFTAEFGSTRCRDLTTCDFSTEAGVLRYVESDGVRHCRELACAVAARARGMIERARAVGIRACGHSRLHAVGPLHEGRPTERLDDDGQGRKP